MSLCRDVVRRVWRRALNQELRCSNQRGDLIAHHTLVVGVVTLVQVTDGKVAANDAGAVAWKVVAVALWEGARGKG